MSTKKKVLEIIGGVLFCLGFLAGINYLALRPSHSNLRLCAMSFAASALGVAIFIFAGVAERNTAEPLIFEPVERPQRPKSADRILLAGAAILVVFFGMAIMSCLQPSPSLDSSESTTSSTTSATIGDICTLRDPTAVAVTHATAERMYQFMAAKDRQGFDDLRMAGAVLIVPAGTKCRLIDLPKWMSGIWEVRLVDSNQLVYVDQKFLVK